MFGLFRGFPTAGSRGEHPSVRGLLVNPLMTCTLGYDEALERALRDNGVIA